MIKTYRIIWVITLAISLVYAKDRDILFEFKGAYFLSTSNTFKNIYGTGNAIYGAELTFKLYKDLYGWASIDFFTGNKLVIYRNTDSCANISTCCQVLSCEGYQTKVMFMPLAFGLKYFVPFANEGKWFTGDFYVGLGIEPTYLQSAPHGDSKDKLSNWGAGGIAKIGTYFNLPRNFFIDAFVDYSFVRVKQKKYTTNLAGCIFGASLGYRFS